MNHPPKQPLLRFSPFSDDWIEKKLGDCFTERSERSANGELVSVTINSGVVKTTELDRKDNSSADKSNYKVVKEGDISYNSMRMWQGASGYSPFNGILSPAYTVICPKEQMHSKFFAYYFKRYEMICKFQINSQGLTSDTWNLKFPLFENIRIDVPSYSEQTAIDELFSTLDRLIALQQRKCDLLEQSKQTYLQKLFPRAGARVPELRFSAFSDDWQERKLGEVYEKVSEKNDLKFGKEKIISVANMYYKSDAKISSDEYLKTYNIFKLGDIAFEGNKSKQFKYGRFVANTIGDGIVSHVFQVFRPIVKYDLSFWKYAINNENLMQQVLVKSTKSSTMMTDLVANDFLKESFKVPTLSEQEKIGLLLVRFDTLITKHKQKLTTLKAVKQTLLGQMFL